MFHGILSTDIDRVWPIVQNNIEEAVKTARGKYTVEDLHQELKDRDCQLWIYRSPTARGVFVTQIHSYKRQKVCGIRIATGHNYQEWMDEGMSILEAWAKEQGCDAIELIARPGWSRILKGYDLTHVYLEKNL
jgi:hypothetical protein